MSFSTKKSIIAICSTFAFLYAFVFFTKQQHFMVVKPDGVEEFDFYLSFIQIGLISLIVGFATYIFSNGKRSTSVSEKRENKPFSFCY